MTRQYFVLLIYIRIKNLVTRINMDEVDVNSNLNCNLLYQKEKVLFIIIKRTTF